MPAASSPGLSPRAAPQLRERAKNRPQFKAEYLVTHAITGAISYALSIGHEIRLGIESDAIEDFYARPNLTWHLMKRMTLTAGAFFEHGKQQGGRLTTEENYDWYGPRLSLEYAIMDRLKASLNYRLTLRSSDNISREYTQNLVGLLLTYTPK